MDAQPSPTIFLVESNGMQGDRKLGSVLEKMEFNVAHCPSAESFLTAAEQHQEGCAVAHLRQEGMSGIELQAKLNETASLLPLILVSERASTQIIVRAMQNGAVSFLDLPINEDDLWLAIRGAIAENAQRVVWEKKKNSLQDRFSQLSEGEQQVLNKVCEGLTNKEIASQLDVSVRTVESRKRRLLIKTGCESFPELLMSYQQFKSTTSGLRRSGS